MTKGEKIIKYIIIFSVFFGVGWFSSNYYNTYFANQQILNSPNGLQFATNSSTQELNNTQADLKTFWQVWKMLQTMYVDEKSLNSQTMVYGSIKGLVSSLKDPYTVYMTPTETKEFEQNLDGQLEGIGAELTVRDQNLVVVSPLKDSPAEKAGIKPADIIYKIDGKITSEMTMFDAIMKIRGTKGTKVTLTIVRKNTKDPFDVTITRDTVNVDSVTLEDEKNGIFRVSINQFSENTKVEFDKIINQVLLKDPKGIILDLRNNGGGYLDIAVDILSDLLKGQVKAVTIKKRNVSDIKAMYVTGKPLIADIPIVVLINHGSASASEIVAGAIQDHKRGILMGQQSFGKGSVQEVDKLDDGSSLRVTIAKWYTPNDNNIDKTGIKPDITVEEGTDPDKDNQLEAAIKYLKDLKSK